MISNLFWVVPLIKQREGNCQLQAWKWFHIYFSSDVKSLCDAQTSEKLKENKLSASLYLNWWELKRNTQLFFFMPCHHGNQLDASLGFVWMLLFCSALVMNLYNLCFCFFLKNHFWHIYVHSTVFAQFEMHFEIIFVFDLLDVNTSSEVSQLTVMNLNICTVII